jgi:hypothetical protein
MMKHPGRYVPIRWIQNVKGFKYAPYRFCVWILPLFASFQLYC